MKATDPDLERAARRAVIVSRGHVIALRAQRRRRVLERLRRTC